MTMWIQRLVVRLDTGILRKIFHQIYSLGLFLVVRGMSRLPQVHSIFGVGSFFEGRCIHGHSDIDLVIVINAEFSRLEGGHIPVAVRYNRIRRFFPFLGRWQEKAGALIYLQEVERGFPLPTAFVLRHKRNHLHLLSGPEFPHPISKGPVDGYDIACQLSTYIRVAVMTHREFGSRLMFWKRMFNKAAELGRELDPERVDEILAGMPELDFLDEDDRRLFSRRGNPERMFDLFTDLLGQILELISSMDESVALTSVSAGDGPLLAQEQRTPTHVEATVFRYGLSVERTRSVAAIPLGPLPELFYFPMDTPMTVLEVRENPYRELRRLLRGLAHDSKVGDSVLVDAGEYLYAVSRQEGYVDLVPLDRLRYADVFARLAGRADWSVPRSVHEAQNATARQLYRALQGEYARHEYWIPKAPFPVIYQEDDLDTIDSAFGMLRALLASTGERFCPQTSTELIEHYKQKHPEIGDFLDDLREYQLFLRGARPRRPDANNLYRVLHQFMAQALGQATRFELSDHHRHLGIAVGIITRNRANDLREMLHSLTRQSRPPDEVVIVDNGSTDHTKQTIESYQEQLPLRYCFLGEASIPNARNRVLEESTHEIVAFTDDDAACHADWLSSIERAFLRAENVGIVGGWVEHWPAEDRTMVDRYYEYFHSARPAESTGGLA